MGCRGDPCGRPGVGGHKATPLPHNSSKNPFCLCFTIEMDMMRTNALPFFAYGTLLPGQVNAHFWGDTILTMETAVLPNGRLYDLGHYPMLLEAEGSPVKGMLITVDPAQYETVLARLDALEGYDSAQSEQSEYVRVKRVVERRNGRTQTAWVYMGNITFQPTLPIVKNGDWATYMAHKQKEINTWWQSVNTVAGLHEELRGFRKSGDTDL